MPESTHPASTAPQTPPGAPPGVALITGGGTGIGLAAAQALAGAGWQVVLTGRRQATLDSAAAQLSLRPGAPPAAAFACDVADPAAVRTLFATIEQRFGRLDLLFNNAGSSAPPVPMDELTDEQWRAVVQVNLDGVFFCTRAAFGLMKRQSPMGGRIVNNGSISAHAPRPYSAPYTATKHAITGLTRATALDGRAHRIACGQIDIGNAATDMTAVMAQGVLQPDGSRRAEPRMDVAHVGQAVLYMAQLPLESNVLFMTVMATDMPFVGRG